MVDGAAHRDEDLFIAFTPVRAQLFGEFRLCGPDGTDVPLGNRRARAILAMLCLDPTEPLPRDSIVKLLWPGRFDAQAKGSLRQCLLELGRILATANCEILTISRDRIRLNPGMVRTDLGDLEQALAVGDLDLVGSLLQQIKIKALIDDMQFGAAFDQWIATRRSAIEQRLAMGIADTVNRLRRAGNMASADRLRDAWGIRQVAATPVPMAQLDRRVRVAILPFKPMGTDPGSDYFTDGIVDELISTLGQLPELLVAGRTSSFHFRESSLALPEVARALGVSHLIEGSVQRQGDQIRVHVHLIDGTNGFDLWGERYDGTLEAIFSLQENVAKAVTRALAEALKLDIVAPLARNMTHSKDAYDLYLQSKALSYKMFVHGSLDAAIKLLEQAVAIDPDFAEAWLLKGEVHQLIAIYTACLDRPAEAALTAASVERALAINPKLGQAYSLLGYHQMVKNDFVGGLDLAFEGYRLEPNNPQVAMRLGSQLLFCGRTEDAMRYVEEALAQDPVDGRKYWLRGCAQFNRGKIDAAIADHQRAVDLGHTSIYLATATASKGEHELAVEQYMQTRLLLNKSIFPPAGTTPMTSEVMDAYWLVAAKGVCSGSDEDRDAYCRTLDYLHMTMYDSGDLSIVLPAVFMGYADILFKTVGQRLSPNNVAALLSIWADIDPIWQIWQHPDFIPFAQRIGLTAAWDKYGWPDLLPAPAHQSRPAPD